MYAIELRETVKKKFKILEKRDKKTLHRVTKKVKDIVQDPHREKPLRKPMQNMRRVHIRPFVLVYSIDELGKTVILEEFDHHDKIYSLNLTPNQPKTC